MTNYGACGASITAAGGGVGPAALHPRGHIPRPRRGVLCTPAFVGAPPARLMCSLDAADCCAHADGRPQVAPTTWKGISARSFHAVAGGDNQSAGDTSTRALGADFIAQRFHPCAAWISPAPQAQISLPFKRPHVTAWWWAHSLSRSPQNLMILWGPLRFDRFAANELPQIVTADFGRGAEAPCALWALADSSLGEGAKAEKRT